MILKRYLIQDEWAEQIRQSPAGKVPSSPTFSPTNNNVSNNYFHIKFGDALGSKKILQLINSLWRGLAYNYPIFNFMTGYFIFEKAWLIGLFQIIMNVIVDYKYIFLKCYN